MVSQQFDEREIFTTARRLDSPETRAAYLQQVCGENRDFHDRITALLRGFEGAGNFLESPTPGIAPVDLPPIAEGPGSVIGRYKLLEEIAEGGMGMVYMAEQREPLRRKVALKIIKPGMDTRAVIARFEVERQALAMMDHPNIAKVFDAGETASGRSYFVMELVHGIHLTDYCDQNQLTTRQRLELFVQVCQAVHHAHQKGIIHRDLKPSNVMVTLYDGVPIPKIIDFGIVKATDGQLADRSVFTNYGQMIGTPLYMSPEQAERSGLDVDTRSDIYSLGMMLYELLTGSKPFDEQRVQEAGYDEIRRMIREDDPPRPSDRISTFGATATAISAHRKTDPVRLSGLLRRDLDWIVMKALEKDRTRRYQTASDFARDIQRYLADEPIEARPPTLRDRLVKWTRRHRMIVSSVAFSAFGGAVAAILLGVVILVSAGEGTVKLEFADAAAARQCTIAIDGDEIRIDNLGEPIKLRAGKHQLRIRHGDLEVEAREFDVLKHGTQVLHVSLPARAAGIAGGPAPENQSIDASRAHDLHDSAYQYARDGEYGKAIAAWTQAITLAPDDAWHWFLRALAELADGRVDAYRRHCAEMLRFFGMKQKLAHGACGNVCKACTLVPDAVSDWGTALALADAAVKACPENGEYKVLRGAVLYRAGRWEEALGPLVDGHLLLQDNDDWYFRLEDARACSYLAMAHYRLGHREEARKWHDKMFEQAEAVMADHRSGKFYSYWKDQQTMKLLLPEAPRLLGFPEPPSPADSGRAKRVADSAFEHARYGDYDKAVIEYSQAIQMVPDEATWWIDRAKAEVADGQLDAYRRHCAEMLRYFGNKEKIAHHACHDVCKACSLVPDAVSNWPIALALAGEAVKMCPEDGEYVVTNGGVLYRAGRWQEALGPLMEGHRLLQKALQNGHNVYLRLDDARGCSYLAMAHHRLGHREEARKWFNTMVEQMEAAMEEHRTGKVDFSWNIRQTMKLLRPEAAQLLGIVDVGQPRAPQSESFSGK